MFRPSDPERVPAVSASADSGADDPSRDAESAGGKMDLAMMERALAGILDRFGLTDVGAEMLQVLAEKDCNLFFTASIARLELKAVSPVDRKRSLRLLATPAFLLKLVRTELFSTRELKDFCARYVREDSLLDVKLARLMPGSRSDSYHLETRIVLRILDVLDEISPGPRLLMIIGHLAHYPDQHVASKAALLVGRRLQSCEWVERHISSTDPRIRANVTEALWGVDSALAAHTLRQCLRDKNNRVYGNAMVGLHMLGDLNVRWRIHHLTKDRRPEFRQTAAWVIGELNDSEFTPLLERLLLDPIEGVRLSAEIALGKLHESTLAGIAPDSSPDIRFEVAPACPNTDDKAGNTAVESKPATTLDRVLTGSAESGENTGLVSEPKPGEPASTLPLRDRYVTVA